MRSEANTRATAAGQPDGCHSLASMGSRPTENVETELKFEVGINFVLPDLADVADGVAVTAPEVHLLAASYFDTADLRLAKAGITLRRRTGGADAGWHLKLPPARGTPRGGQPPPRDEAAAHPAPLAPPLSPRGPGA